MRANGVVLRSDKSLADVLLNFLRAAARQPFRWGEFDCCLFFADWIELRCGIDPAFDLRGMYSTEREMRRLVKARGGIMRLVGESVARAGYLPTTQPMLGDIGLVRIGLKRWRDRLIMGPCGAIHIGGNLWAIKSADQGQLAIQPFPLLQAWHG